eukprot:1766748-Amphidinium_carterae.1
MGAFEANENTVQVPDALCTFNDTFCAHRWVFDVLCHIALLLCSPMGALIDVLVAFDETQLERLPIVHPDQAEPDIDRAFWQAGARDIRLSQVEQHKSAARLL